MLLDRLLPIYEFDEVHTIHINASSEAAYRAVKDVTAGEVPLFGVLMGLRSMGARPIGKAPVPRNDQSLLDQLLTSGFVMLADVPVSELVLGTIGKFWQATGGSPPGRVRTAAYFLSFDRPDYAKAVMNFAVVDRKYRIGCRVRTETRIHIPDTRARRKFAAYWFFIRPGSALIRRVWLRAIKKRAEQRN